MSRGSKRGEWTCTAMKAKPMLSQGRQVSPSKKLARKFSFDRLKPSGSSSSGSGSSSGSQKEAPGTPLDILQLAFSPTGDYLASLVQPIATNPSSSSQSTYEALLGIVDGHRGEAHQPVKSSEKYVIVYTTRGEQLEPVVTINDPAQFKREKGAASLCPLPVAPSQHIALTC